MVNVIIAYIITAEKNIIIAAQVLCYYSIKKWYFYQYYSLYYVMVRCMVLTCVLLYKLLTMDIIVALVAINKFLERTRNYCAV